MKTIRLGTGLAFWGDNVKAAIDVVENGDIDYLCCDHLAELTMSILSKRMERDPDSGYTPDIVELLRGVLPMCHERGIKIISNAGGANPRACADRVESLCKELGINGVRIGVVTGDDISTRIDGLIEEGVPLANLDTGAGLDTVRAKLTHANVYIGCEGIVEALEAGADIVICGRVTDVALYLGPMRYEFGWAADDWHHLGIAAAVAHCAECGAQATGGLYSGGWQHVTGMVDIGYPIVEVAEDGGAVITKTSTSGGEVTPGTVSEQMVYEILDPGNYLTADVTGDFTNISLEREGPDRVRISGVTGKPAPDQLKVNMGYRAGFIGTAQWSYTWPDAYLKAKRSIAVLEERLDNAEFVADETRVEWVGHSAMWGPLLPEPDDPELAEVTVRYTARCPSQAEARKVFTELVPICNNGPAGLAGLGTRLPITELYAVWPCLIPRDRIECSVEMRTV